MNITTGGLVGSGFIGSKTPLKNPIQINVNEVSNGFTLVLGYVTYVAKTKEEVIQQHICI